MEVKKEIERITNIFGMRADVAAKAMGITGGTFRKNKSDKSTRHNFNKKNLEDLITYIKEEACKL